MKMDEGKKDIIDLGAMSASSNDNDSNDDVVLLPTTPSLATPNTPFTPTNGHLSSGSLTPTTPSSTNPKKRKRLTAQEREEREKERAEKRIRYEEEKIKKEEEKKKKEEEKRQREEEKRVKEEERKKKAEEALALKQKVEEEKRLKKEQLEEEKRIKKEQEEEKRLKREEEKRQKQEELDRKTKEKELEKKKEEEKLAKQARFFQSFFQKSPGTKKIAPTKVGDLDKSSITSSTTTPTTTDKHSSDTSFVGKSENSSDSASNGPSSGDPALLFKPKAFQIKSHMTLAAIVRRRFTSPERRKLDEYGFCSSSLSKENKDPNANIHNDQQPMDIDSCEDIQHGSSDIPPNVIDDPNYSFLKGLKKHGGRKSGRTELAESEEQDPDVQIVSDKIIENPKAQGLIKWRYKLLQFHDNRRPAYWGTWKRSSATVKPRRPLGQEKEFDYEYDSDDDWEEEPEDGEDLANSDKEDDPENAESGDDEEDGWLVPHGYISDDEGAQDEHLDKELLKMEEKHYFEGLNKQIKVNYPEIQTHKLIEYKMVFAPSMKKWKETSSAFKTFNPVPSTASTSSPFLTPDLPPPSSLQVCHDSPSLAVN